MRRNQERIVYVSATIILVLILSTLFLRHKDAHRETHMKAQPLHGKENSDHNHKEAHKHQDPVDYFTIIHADNKIEKRPVIRVKGDLKPSASRLHGPVGFYRNGTPGWRPVPMPERPESFEEKRRAHKPNCFNLRRSDSLPLDRPVPDVRHSKCASLEYPKDLPQTSVVFVFLNEPLSPLLRSIISVLNRTPPRLLKEIILVDDGSDADFTKGPLEEFLQLLPKIVLRRCPKRKGLMAARSEGARIATAEVVTFLDSHIEVNEKWVEPMLARIKEDRKHVVMPIIDSIEPDVFDYHAGGLDILAFNWALGQHGVSRQMSDTEPMPSPVMAGGLFAMDRHRFWELGGYDPQMSLYGGEEMEISLRLWMCGSTLECIPCSRVGHIFRTSKYYQGQVYKVPNEIIIRNKLRAAAMWLPEHLDRVRHANNQLPPGMTIGELSWGEEIKERLKCKNFKWYLKNVFPELFVPDDPDYVLISGSVTNEETNACLDTLGHAGDGDSVGAYPCHPGVMGGTQDFLLSAKHELRIAGSGLNYEMCVDRASSAGMSMYHCHGGGGNQHWEHDEETGHLFSDKQCLEIVKKDDGSFDLRWADCVKDNPRMNWMFQPIPHKKGH
eukprot:m.65547 g.65547  ORF g.65547 m.65547 type:complete len:611 (+) comp11743_c0_seq3:67-1899(+)